MIAAAAASSASSLAGSAFSKVLMSILLGNFNPEYNRESRRRMRYIQQKYSLAYEGGKAGEDPCAIIQQIDPNSKLLMSLDGKKPANPFPDERAYEDSLVMNFHPVSGHQGRFVGSHVMTSIGVINDYQNQRRRRPYVPGVTSPGRPNDYINLFLEETKQWLRTQLSLDIVHAEELRKREKFYSKLKNDNYFWCFPQESESCNIHKVIDFVHDKVKNALEIISREEMNKSLQLLFKELNDNTTNFFEFSKQFLAYLLYHSKKVGSNISTSNGYDGKSIETGKFHYLLQRATAVVFETYRKDLEQSNQMIGVNDRLLGSSPANNTDVMLNENYILFIKAYENSNLLLSSTTYLLHIEDPLGNKWVVRKTWNDFETLNNVLSKELLISTNMRLDLPDKKVFGDSITKMLNHSEYQESIISSLNDYCWQISSIMNQMNERCLKLVANFLETKCLRINYNNSSSQSSQLKYAESIPNVFLPIREYFQNYLVGNPNLSTSTVSTNNTSNSSQIATISSKFSNFFGLGGGGGGNRGNNNSNNKSSEMKEDPIADPRPRAASTASENHQLSPFLEEFSDRDFASFQKTWGPEFATKIIESYALLQRIATVLGWTLEINHFFISMFGNTLTFSKLPLRDIIITQKELITKFIGVSNELYEYACQANSESQYKFHKNLQMTENELLRVKFHGNKAISIITTIETEHLDYEAQMRRLRDVNARFQPFMNRIGGSLAGIKAEAGLPAPSYTFAEYLSAGMNPSNPVGYERNRGEVLQIENGGVGSSQPESRVVIISEESKLSSASQPKLSSKSTRPTSANEDVEIKISDDDDKGSVVVEASSTAAASVVNNNPTVIEGNAAFAIFSRSSSETVRPAVDKSNPLFADEPVYRKSSGIWTNPNALNPEFTGDSKPDEKQSQFTPSVIRNEESSAVCIIS